MTCSCNISFYLCYFQIPQLHYYFLILISLLLSLPSFSLPFCLASSPLFLFFSVSVHYSPLHGGTAFRLSRPWAKPVLSSHFSLAPSFPPSRSFSYCDPSLLLLPTTWWKVALTGSSITQGGLNTPPAPAQSFLYLRIRCRCLFFLSFCSLTSLLPHYFSILKAFSLILLLFLFPRLGCQIHICSHPQPNTSAAPFSFVIPSFSSACC